MAWPRTSDERYQADPVFHALVDMLYHQLESQGCKDWTPSDLREAALLAGIMYEVRHIRPIILSREPYQEFLRPRRPE